MSAKQLRKLRDLREAEASRKEGADKTRDEEESEEDLKEEEAQDSGARDADGIDDDDDDDDEAEVGAAQRRPGFSALLGDSSSDDSGGSGGEAGRAAGQANGLARPPLEGGARGGDPKEGDVQGGRRRRRRKGGAVSAPGQPSVARGPSDAGPTQGRGTGEGQEEISDDEDALLEAAAREAREALDDEATGEQTAASSLGRVLAMRRPDFSVENERRRAVGSGAGIGGEAPGGPRGRRAAARQRGSGEGRTAHHRRLFLVTPTADEPWPRPDDCMAMVATTDEAGAAVFDFEETAASARSLEQLRQCLRAQDPQLLQRFLQRNPFCVDGLVTLGEHLRSQHSHEQACQLVRRAVYALECSLNPAFSPFAETGLGPSALRPRVALKISDDPSWPGWTWLRTFWMHMHGLAGQGMHRTALEICKFVAAATLPRDPGHVLPVLDFLCVRARQYDALARFATQLAGECGLGRAGAAVGPRLDLAMPNFAYSVALAGFLKTGAAPDPAALNEVGIADVTEGLVGGEDGAACAEEASAPGGAALHAQLIRALLVFPFALRPLLDEAGVSRASAPAGSCSREAWTTLLSQPPFSDAADFRHSRHGAVHARLCAAYAKRCGALWRADLVVRWLHSCVARVVSMHASSVFAAELAAARTSWSLSPLCLEEALQQDYVDLLPEEGSTEAPLPPPAFDKAIQARLHPPAPEPGELGGPLEEFARGFGFGGAGGGAPGRPPPTLSLHSPPLLLFFQSLLPWAELDSTGVAVEPFGWTDVARSAAAALCAAAVFGRCLAGDVPRLAGMAWEAARARWWPKQAAAGGGRRRR